MATNLCAECGTRLPRPEYKTHMQQVHGVQVMDDSDDERTDLAPQQVETQEAPRPQRQRRGRHAAAQPSDIASIDTNGTAKGAGEGTAPGSQAYELPPARQGDSRTAGRRNRRSGRSRRTARSGDGVEEGAPAPPAGEFPCSECDRAFASPQGLMRHTQAKHPGTDAAEAAAAAAAAAYQPPARRDGRPRRADATPTTANDTANIAAPEGDAAAQQPAVGIPAPSPGNRAPYTIRDITVVSSARRRSRPRRSRGDGSRGAAPPAAPFAGPPEATSGPEGAEAAASAAAVAALGGPPASAPAGSASGLEARQSRLVNLFRCKICEQGFKSKNRARAHVAEAHPDAVPAAEAEGNSVGQEGGEVAADGLLEQVQVTARRAPRSQTRRDRKPAATSPEPAAVADSNSDPNASGGDAGATGSRQSRPATAGRRRGRPRRPRNASAGATGVADAVAVVPPTGSDTSGRPAEVKVVPEDLAALGIVAAS